MLFFDINAVCHEPFKFKVLVKWDEKWILVFGYWNELSIKFGHTKQRSKKPKLDAVRLFAQKNSYSKTISINQGKNQIFSPYAVEGRFFFDFH